VKDLAWSEILSVGVDEIDEDHRKLIHIFNILNHAVAEKEPPEYLAATLDELINCTVWHFSHEERLMLKHRYRETEEHKAEHRDLIQSAKELQQKILQADQTVAEEHLVFLERWLTGHILTTDARMASHLSKVM
jgi:hemerythrin